MKLPSHLRAFDDMQTAREWLHTGTVEALQNSFPIEDKDYKLELDNVRIDGPQTYGLERQKNELMRNGQLRVPVKGRWRLTHKQSGEVLDERDDTVLHLPYLTDRGTMIYRGNEYSTVSQSRLKPGVYARRKKSGELESFFNVRPGTGRSFRVWLEPQTGVFKVKVGQSNIPLYPMLSAMGVGNDELSKAWGADILEANRQVRSSQAVDKLYSQFTYGTSDEELSEDARRDAFIEALKKSEVDPSVVARTLGLADTGNVNSALLTRASRKLLDISRGSDKPDDRDAPMFSNVLSVEDLIKERIDKDAGRVARSLLFKARRDRNLKRIPPGALNAYAMSFLLGSRLTLPLEETNPLALLEQMSRVTKLGVGGISDADAVTDEARNVNIGQRGFIDPITGPEDTNIGIDTRVAYRTFKGRDQQMYGEFKDARTGKLSYLRPEDLDGKVVAFPGEMDKGKPYVAATVEGELREVPRESVDIEIPSMAHMFSQNTNLNVMPTTVQPGRQFYGSKFWSQYMPQVKGEAPLVDSLVPGSDKTFSEHLGRRIGSITARKPATVTRVTDKKISLVDADGEKSSIDLVQNFPYNRITGLSYRPAVKAGDGVDAGDVLARSNFVDDNSSLALGQNLHVGIIPYKGASFEDGLVISEEAADKLSTQRLYGYDVEAKRGVTLDRNRYAGLFPDNFTQDQLKNIDEHGLVKPGTKLTKGDPIILATGPKLLTAEDVQLGRLHKALRNAHTDHAEIWEQDYDGIVTDAVRTQSGAKVNVKADVPVQVGDKLCYDTDTEVLTSEGWKYISNVTLYDKVATLDPSSDRFYYGCPESVQQYRHKGRMYALNTGSLDLRTTDNHKLYVQHGGDDYALRDAFSVYGKRVHHKQDAAWDAVCVPMCYLQCGGHEGQYRSELLQVSKEALVAVLGAWLSSGSITPGGDVKLKLSEDKCTVLKTFLSQHGVLTLPEDGGLRLPGEHWTIYFRRLEQRHIPDNVFTWSCALQRTLRTWFVEALKAEGASVVHYVTAFKQLADDLQRLWLHTGGAAQVRYDPDTELYSVYDSKASGGPRPVTNAGECNERWIDYDGTVHCVTMPEHNIIYVRRNGCPVWCGNSPRWGLKGVVSEIVPQDRMPRHAGTNEPLDLLLNPMTILSRVAAGSLAEMQLGKLAKLRGQQFKLPQLPPAEGWRNWTLKELEKAGVGEKDQIFDPELGRALTKPVTTGRMYWMAFHHLADKKLSDRGSSGVGYTQDELPARGGGDTQQAKRMSSMDVNQLLAHGATDVLRDAQVIRGARNEDYWNALRLGRPLPEPDVPFVYKKFLKLLNASGINIEQKGDTLKLLPMLDSDIDKLSRGEIASSGMVDDKMNPIPGGLFDPGRTGGTNGKFWSHIKLSEPMPNPIFEEPIRRLLGLRKQDLIDVVAGRQELKGKTGGQAIRDALADIDIDSEIASQRDNIRNLRGANRDNAVKKLGYLSAAKKQGIHPSQWVLNKLPVLPPVFRPVSRLGDITLEADLNELYRDTIEVNNTIGKLRNSLPEDSLQDEKETLYRAVQAVTGLGEPITAEGRSRRLKGAMRTVVGDSPKTGFYQSRVMSKPMDTIGRAVASPDPTLDMDSVGLPEDSAWKLYRDFVLRRLVRQNMPTHVALKLIEERKGPARDALVKEMQARPIIMDRAPTWHKFNLLAFNPHLVEGSTIRVSPLITKGFTMDFNGDSIVNHLVLVKVDGIVHNITLEHLIQEYIMPEYNEANALDLIGVCTYVMALDKKRISVLGFNSDGTAGFVPVEQISIHTSHVDECFKVKTECGMDTIFTGHHNFWSVTPECELVPMKTTEISEGTLVPYAATFELPTDVECPEGPDGVKLELTHESGFWFGHYLGDGSVTGRLDTVSQAATHDDLRDYIEGLGITMLPGIDAWVEGNGKSVRWTKKAWAAWYMVQFGHGAADKRVPDWVLGAPVTFKAGFIAGLLAADGSVYPDRLEIEMVNRDILVAVRTLAHSFGCVTRLRNGRKARGNNKPTWILTFNSSTFDCIPVAWPDVKRLHGFRDRRRNTRNDWDIVPFPADVAARILERGRELAGGGGLKERRIIQSIYGKHDLNGAHKQLTKAAASGYMTRAFARRLITGRGLGILAGKDEGVARWLELVDNTTIWWTRVTSIKTSERPRITYDMSVPGFHAFAFDGTYMTHNTVNFHVPASDKAVTQAYDKMMPSKNLFSLTDLESPRHTPQQEMALGLYMLTRARNRGKPRMYNTVSQARRAYKAGDIGANDPIIIRELR